jgi:uroporphyrinogen decarboxylase
MTPRERLLAVLHRELPDCVPCCPDISNMVPARLTGKPFWDVYVYQDPPLWKAYIDAVKHFDLDGGFENYSFEGGLFPDESVEDRIVHRDEDGAFVTRRFYHETGAWSPTVVKHTRDNPPATALDPQKLGLPAVPDRWEPIEGAREWPTGLDLWRLVVEETGEQGVTGLHCGCTTCVLRNPEDVYAYTDDPGPFRERRDRSLERIDERLAWIATLEPRPDFLFCGGSGSLIWQTPAIFEDLALPLLRRATEGAAKLGIPTHVHSCGPEKELVRLAATETQLTVIDPLEVPPMGDCRLAELKEAYGDRIVLKGNLHTTEVMLYGSPDDVRAAARRAIDDAAGLPSSGQTPGRFILSTGDQCGRDTPDANLHAMVEIARTYGRYD